MKKHLLASLLLGLATTVLADPVDLSSWTAEGDGIWTVAGGNQSVFQSINGEPTVFYSDFTGQGLSLGGKIQVETSDDNDFIGFVLGFQPGDITAAAPNYILIDWKQGDQTEFGCLGKKGLAISRVTGPIGGGGADPWCHQGVVSELARGTTLDDTGWADNTLYDFELVFTPTNIQVFVNGVKELDINGTFGDGRFGFYNFSQPRVRYSAVEFSQFPLVSLTPAGKTFDPVEVGTESDPQTFTVRNTGTAELLLGTLAITGNDASDFRLANDNCSGQTLAVETGSCTIDAIFAPNSEGAKATMLSVPSNAPDTPTEASLAGEGIPRVIIPIPPRPVPALSLASMWILAGLLGLIGFRYRKRKD